MSASPSVLVDACWFRHGFPWQLKIQTTVVRWGGTKIELPIETGEPKEYPAGVLRAEVPLLPAIAALAEGGMIRLFRSDAVLLESLEHPASSQPGRPGHVFQRVHFTKIKCGFNPPVEIRAKTLPTVAGPEDQLKTYFAGCPDEELRELVRYLGPSHCMDAVHLLTASRHGLDFFLCDSAFRGTYMNYLRTGTSCLRTRAVTPSVLLRLLHPDSP